MSAPRPNAYDVRQMRLCRNRLLDALKQAEFMLEDHRSLADRECRALLIENYATEASRHAGLLWKRFYREYVRAGDEGSTE